MIKLCGFALSNYYNKVKFVLLEHGIPFEEVFVMTSQEEAHARALAARQGAVYPDRTRRPVRVAGDRRISGTRAFPRRRFFPPIRGKRRRSAN